MQISVIKREELWFDDHCLVFWRVRDKWEATLMIYTFIREDVKGQERT